MVAVTFLYRADRLPFLAAIGENLKGFGVDYDVFVVTDVHDAGLHEEIRVTVGGGSAQIVAPNIVGHPYLLTWIHREVFKREFLASDKHSHFLYLEDDIDFSQENFDYWEKSLKLLRPHGLIPGFVRFETDRSGVKYSSDFTKRKRLSQLPRIRCGSSLFINPRFPYQGMYIMDRELMAEFLTDKFFGPDFGQWGIREKANQGLIFANVPDGCHSRSFVGYEPGGGFSRGALIHHMANNYVNDPETQFGSLRVDELVIDENAMAVSLPAELIIPPSASGGVAPRLSYRWARKRFRRWRRRRSI